MRGFVAVVSLAFVLVAGDVLASGAGEVKEPEPAAEEPTPQERAEAKYNSGLKHLEKADKALAEGRAGGDQKQRTKLEEKAREEYEKALKDFDSATKFAPKLFQAWSSLGYAQRKTGHVDQALAAYDRALELEPRFSPAIEYRAEAYLGLGRLEDVKAAYMALFAQDRARADELQRAMEVWVTAPKGADAAAAAAFGEWLGKRKEIAAQTPATAASVPAGW